MKKAAVMMFALASVLCSQVWAHAHLKQPTPAADTTVAAPSELRLGFTEGIEPAFSEVTLTSSKGGTVKTELHRAEGDASVLVAQPVSALTAGVWDVKWKVVSVDTHRSEGHYTFTVK